MEERKRGYNLNLTEDARQRIGWRRGLALTRYTKICEVCGESFETVPTSSKQYCCSRECQFRRLRKTKPIFTCAFCKKEFISKSHKKNATFCSRRCAVQSRYANHIYKIRPSEVLKRKNMRQCTNCGYNKIPNILERHHKDFNHENNSPSNFIVLCPTCHDEIHYLAGNGLKYRQF